ncbi:metallophosphoesterase [Patescibacteria group bacterium]|nr:metallophosphoesterase [Patescibacteria group bacterium]
MSKKILKILAILVVLFVLVISDSYLQAYYPEIVQNEILFDSMPSKLEDVKIVFLSDVHYGPRRSENWLKMIITAVNAQDPDLVLLGGDYVDYHADYVEPVIRELSKIDAPLGIYAVMGNHDYFRAAELMPVAMEKYGIKLIDNKNTWIDLGEGGFWLGGIADPTYGEPDYKKAEVDVKAEDFFILLSHTPDQIITLPDSMPDLVLSGHTHGGQITLFGKWVPYVPSVYGTDYISGLYKINSMKLLVSNGVGTFKIPFRWFAPAQINVLTLKNADI